jgi:hypothetical protein
LDTPSLFGEGRGGEKYPLYPLEDFTPFVPLKGEYVEKNENAGKVLE